MCGCAARSRLQGPLSRRGHVYFALKDDKRRARRRDLEDARSPRMRLKPEEGLEVIVTGRLTTYPGRSQLPDRRRDAGARRPRRADGAAGRAQAKARRRGPVRRGAQAAAAVPARGDRRRHLADRRGDPRHPASARRPLPAPRAGLAGEGAGRKLGRRSRRRDRRLQRAAGARRAAAARSAHRRARRRLARGSVVVQRGDRGARRGGKLHSADLRGRPRDRHDADRFRRRPARADADRGRRNGGAGARRTHARCRFAGAARARLLAAQSGGAAQRVALGRARAAGRRRSAWHCRGSGSIMPRRGLRRALHANAQIHRVGFSRIAGRLEPAFAAHQLSSAGASAMPVSRSGFAPAWPPISKSIRTRIARQNERVAAFAERGERAIGVILDRRTAQLERGAQLLAAFSYRGVLARGFALVRDAAGQPLRTAAAVSAGMAIDIEFADGRVGAGGRRCASNPGDRIRAAIPRRRRHSGGGEGQGNLF